MKKRIKIVLSLLFAALMLASAACSGAEKAGRTPTDPLNIAAEPGEKDQKDEAQGTQNDAQGSEADGAEQGTQNDTRETEPPILKAEAVPENYESIREVTHYIEEQIGWGDHFDLLIDMVMPKDNWGNVVYSPLSLNMLLAMISNGASDALRSDFEAYFNSALENYNRYFYQTYFYLSRNGQNAAARFANVFFLRDLYEFEDGFLNEIETCYGAEHLVCPFDESFVERANAWCAKNTDGLIREMPSVSVDGTDGIALNAILFNSKWATGYTDYNVRETDFRLPLYEQAVKVTGLYSTETTYLENDQAIGFMKPFAPEADGSSRYAFVGILPKVTADDKVQNGFDSFDPAGENDPFDFDLSRIDFQALLETATHEYEVEVMIPEFSFEQTIDLLPAMEAVGLSGITQDLAFPGLAVAKDNAGNTIQANFTLTYLLQKARIEVTREGVKAAAVSQAGFTGAAAVDYSKHKEVLLDRPFAFMIYDMKAQSALFVGKVVNPAEQN